MEEKKNYYYNVFDDIDAHPECFAFIVHGGRSTGKTYGALKGSVQRHEPFCYVKRTVDDVKLICAGNSQNRKSKISMDLSPFKSINRDTGWNIRAIQIYEGLGGFYRCNDENEPVGDPYGYIMALNAVSKFKGFDMSEVDNLIIDEFVPKKYDIIRRGEGIAIMDLYKTLCRDREHRGRPALKLIALANADSITSPLTDVMEITDTIVDMIMEEECERIIEGRGIYLRKLKSSGDFYEREKQTAIMKAMAGTKWAGMALENDFAFNDFSDVKHLTLKGYKPHVKFFYNREWYYIYYTDSGNWAVTGQKFNKKTISYNLDKESDQRKFWLDVGIWLKQEWSNGNCKFSKYTLFDLIVNYSKFFKI